MAETSQFTLQEKRVPKLNLRELEEGEAPEGTQNRKKGHNTNHHRLMKGQKIRGSRSSYSVSDCESGRERCSSSNLKIPRVVRANLDIDVSKIIAPVTYRATSEKCNRALNDQEDDKRSIGSYSS